MEAGLSEDHLGVLDEVVPVSSLDNAVDPGVESGQFGEGVFNVSASLGVGGEVGSFLGEEVGSESFVSVAENSVSVVAELGGDILAHELNLVAQVSLSSLGGLLCLLVVRFASISGVSWLDSADVEACSEGVGAVVWGVEQIVERGRGKVGVLAINLGQNDGGHAVV